MVESEAVEEALAVDTVVARLAEEEGVCGGLVAGGGAGVERRGIGAIISVVAALSLECHALGNVIQLDVVQPRRSVV